MISFSLLSFYTKDPKCIVGRPQCFVASAGRTACSRTDAARELDPKTPVSANYLPYACCLQASAFQPYTKYGITDPKRGSFLSAWKLAHQVEIDGSCAWGGLLWERKIYSPMAKGTAPF